ncbi:MAG: redoxin domain-containing protein [Pegethrix bostrychoides GSE-TBD4-15B]|jgi:sugar lactone lactonase YvrE/thiol-disulfide isomerase/thioredoxin|uniref:Redoxin domain-containing protein n=1 Tax=Pegethrix bostrychoides GSE-TBD4-15B TaxID=2839662 RepID=A0A951PDK6_9CYAN|nr:redoxin domain-containing protein [Pegethrix bostrychoides GSE-TBD4-15B]
MVRIHAPELPPTLPWINSPPLSLAALKGRVVLLDFWTYGCINCLHVLPDLRYLEQKYRDHLSVIGIHSAKFDHEKAETAVQQAVQRYDIQHPVVIDSHLELWQQYAVRAWPTFVLIDPDGYIVEHLTGEGQRQRLDRHIAELVQSHTAQGRLVFGHPHRLTAPAEVDSTLAFPGKLLADPASNRLFVADTGHHRILVLRLAATGHHPEHQAPQASIQQIFGLGEAGLWDGDAAEALFSAPQGLAFDAEQQWLYVADTGNHCLRKIDLYHQTVETIAGLGTQSQVIYPHSGDAREIALNSPWDLALFRHFLLIAMAGAHQIWSLDLLTQRLSTFVGSGAEACIDGDFDSDMAPAFAQPSGLALDGQTLYVADSEGSTVRAVSLSGSSQVRSICGSGSLSGFGDRDGQGEAARLQHCMGLACDPSHQLWIADSYNHKIKSVDPQTGICTTRFGSGQAGFRDGAQGAQSACFNEPTGLSQSGNWLYVADSNNHAIRCVNLQTLEVTTLVLHESVIHPA